MCWPFLCRCCLVIRAHLVSQSALIELIINQSQGFFDRVFVIVAVDAAKINYSSWLHSMGMLVFCFNASRTCYFDFAPTLKQITYFAVGRMRPE